MLEHLRSLSLWVISSRALKTSVAHKPQFWIFSPVLPSEFQAHKPYRYSALGIRIPKCLQQNLHASRQTLLLHLHPHNTQFSHSRWKAPVIFCYTRCVDQQVLGVPPPKSCLKSILSPSVLLWHVPDLHYLLLRITKSILTPFPLVSL